MAAGSEHRPLIVGSEKLLGDRMHMHQIVEIGADPAQDAEDHLHEERRLDPALIDEPSEIVEMAKIIAFKLEFRAMAMAQLLHHIFDVAERVAEDEVPAHLQETRLPIVFPGL